MKIESESGQIGALRVSPIRRRRFAVSLFQYPAAIPSLRDSLAPT